MSAIAFPGSETQLDDRATTLVLVFIVLALLSSAAQLMFPGHADPQGFEANIVAMDG
jgi:hypothetical protein